MEAVSNVKVHTSTQNTPVDHSVAGEHRTPVTNLPRLC